MFNSKLLSEAQLSDKLKADIDSIINILQDYKDADYEGIPRGAPYTVSGWLDPGNTANGYGKVSDDLISFLIAKILDSSKSIKQYGKTQVDLDRIENERKSRDAIRYQALQGANNLKTYFEKVEAKFPRYFKFLNIEEYAPPKSFMANFAVVEPSGVRKDLRVLVGEESEHEENVRKTLSKCIRLFRHPDYKKLESKVQQLRDFGFNVTGKLLNTDGGTFRTRYALITNVILAYKGVGINSNLDIGNVDDEGSAILRTTQRGGTGHALVGVQTGHIGEIIDTIDILLHVLHSLPLYLNDIDLIGREVVEYRLGTVTRGIRHASDILIQSVDIKDVTQLTKLLYEKLRNYQKI